MLGGVGRAGHARCAPRDAERLAGLLRERRPPVEPGDRGALSCAARTARAVGQVAADHGVALAELVAVSRSLEDVFFELTEGEA